MNSDLQNKTVSYLQYVLVIPVSITYTFKSFAYAF